jgi:hypothetical protein
VIIDRIMSEREIQSPAESITASKLMGERGKNDQARATT